MALTPVTDMPGQNKGEVFSSVQQGRIIKENDGSEGVNGQKADDGKKDAKGLGSHLHGAQRDPVGAPASSVTHFVFSILELEHCSIHEI